MADSLALIYLPEPFIFFSKHVKLRLGLGFYIFSPLLEWSDDMELLCFKTSYLFFTTSCYVTFDFNFSFMGRTALWGTTGALFLPSFFHSWLMRFLMMKFRARGLPRKFRVWCPAPVNYSDFLPITGCRPLINHTHISSETVPQAYRKKKKRQLKNLDDRILLLS